MRNSLIAAAVTAALSLSVAATASAAAGPTPTQASGATHKVFVAGSSAAAAGVVSFIESNVCGGTYSQFTTPTSTVNAPDFRAVSCTVASTSAGFPVGSTATIWYRAEGGSVVGVFPVINNVAIKFFDIVNAGCNTTSSTLSGSVYVCTGVTGSAPNNGTNDTWGGGVLTHTVDVGVSDLEPAVFGNTGIGSTNAYAGGGNHDPVGTYVSSFTGADRATSDLADSSLLPQAAIFQQTFGFIVSSNLGISDLPREQIAAIFDGLASDWSQVNSGADTAVGSGTIVVCNREVGSGTRASADIFLNSTGCDVPGTVNPLVEQAGGPGQPAADNFQTSAEIDCVNSHTNAIGYVSVDNFSKVGPGTSDTAAVKISVSGVTGSPLNSSLGVYGDVYEASLNENTHASSDGITFYSNILPKLQAVATTSTSAQVAAIPGLGTGDTASVPLTKAANGVYVSQFTRSANSCTPLTYQ